MKAGVPTDRIEFASLGRPDGCDGPEQAQLEAQVIGLATRVLRVQFARLPDDTVLATPTEDLIEFVAYTREFLVAALLAMRADRMTDLLNAVDELELHDTLVQWLHDGALRGAETLSIERVALVAVKANAPRGNPARRHPTGRVSVAAGCGPLLMHGDLHVRRGGDARADLGRRPPMIPLTDATIRFSLGGKHRVDHAETLIVNRDVVDWMQPATDEDLVRLTDQYRSRGQ
jgi:hypothetical protein